MVLHSKERGKSLSNTYKHISLTSVVSEEMETIMHIKVVSCFEDKKLIKVSMINVRVKNLLDFYKEVYNTYVDEIAVNVIDPYVQKAFDKVPTKVYYIN